MTNPVLKFFSVTIPTKGNDFGQWVHQGKRDEFLNKMLIGGMVVLGIFTALGIMASVVSQTNPELYDLTTAAEQSANLTGQS
jgi:hypothetical protein